MSKTVNAFLDKAYSFVGTVGSIPFITAYNALKEKGMLPRGYAMQPSDDWCACFVSSIGTMLNLNDIILPECSCGKMVELYKAKGQWIEDDSILPQPGYILFYDWQDTGDGDNTGFPDHVGIVLKVENNVIHVIEGNYGVDNNKQKNRVEIRKISVNSRYIRGYATPKYEVDIKPEIHFDLLQGNKNSVTIGGWAIDRKNPDKAVSVHVYAVDTKGGKTKIADFLAFQPREDVGNHSFCYTINTDLIGEQQIVLAAIDTVDPVHKHTWSEVKDCYIDFDVKVGDTICFDISCLRPYDNYIFLDIETGKPKSKNGVVTDQQEGKVVDISYFKDPRYKNFNYLVRTSNTYVFVAKDDILKVEKNK